MLSTKTIYMRNIFFSIAFLCSTAALSVADVLLEAEHFDNYGGWAHDSQFMNQMGSPFLMAHGFGVPVADAETKVNIEPGRYRVWVRTRDWVATWGAPGHPGKFQVLLNGKPLDETFGTFRAEWSWQHGGIVDITAKENTVTLRDLTGFAGRCDVIYFSKNLDAPPTNHPERLKELRRRMLGLPEQPETAGEFDLEVVGGGISGTCAAISAARQGLSVALIQDRPVLGGNNSSEVRVWLLGAKNRAPYNNIGNIVTELEPVRRGHYGPSNTADIYEDERRLDIVRKEENIQLFLEHFVNGIEMDGDKIVAVIAEQTKTGRQFRFAGTLFADTTGDGDVGAMAGADYEMAVEEGHLGPTNIWNVIDTGTPQTFPRTPWALDLSDKPFPGRANRNTNDLGVWFWQSGFFHDPIEQAEYIRDSNFRAAYGAWDALKNVDNVLPNHKINWMAYIAGKRESRRLLGDYILTGKDVLEGIEHKDGCVPGERAIDLHYPDKRYEKGFEGDAFIATAQFTQVKPYWIPYRCLYSRNISNLFMAGRNFSATREGLGSARVMRTGGCMGEVVGLAAAVCVQEKTTPRGVYTEHLDKLFELIKNLGWELNRREVTAATFADRVGRNIAPLAKLKTSGERDEHTSADLLVDGYATLSLNEDRWVSNAEGDVWIELTWEQPRKIAAIRIISGHDGGREPLHPMEDFTVRIVHPAESVLLDIKGNGNFDFQRLVGPTEASALRIDFTKFQPPSARIWEVEVYEAKE